MINARAILLWWLKNQFEISEYKLEQAHITQLLAKNSPIKVIQSFISTVNTC